MNTLRSCKREAEKEAISNGTERKLKRLGKELNGYAKQSSTRKGWWLRV